MSYFNVSYHRRQDPPVRRRGPVKDWATLDAPHLEIMREMAAEGLPLRVMGERLGWDQSKVQRFLERNNITRIGPRGKKFDNRPIVIVIPPLRLPTTNGIQGSGGFDLEDTEEL